MCISTALWWICSDFQRPHRGHISWCCADMLGPGTWDHLSLEAVASSASSTTSAAAASSHSCISWCPLDVFQVLSWLISELCIYNDLSDHTARNLLATTSHVCICILDTGDTTMQQLEFADGAGFMPLCPTLGLTQQLASWAKCFVIDFNRCTCPPLGWSAHY